MKNQLHDNMTRAKFEASLYYYRTFWNYLKEYQNAFNTLMNEVERSDTPVDTFAHPLLFIARHCMELGFKANIRYFAAYSESSDFTNSGSHNLVELFKWFKTHVYMSIRKLKAKYDIEVKKEDVSSFESLCKEVESLIVILDKLDGNSISFRYPVDKSHKPIFGQGDKINLLDVKVLFDKALQLLFHTSSVFSPYTDYADMIEKNYEDEIRRNYNYYQ